MRTFIENYLHFMKNCIRPHYEKLKPLKSGFMENSNFENNRDPCTGLNKGVKKLVTARVPDLGRMQDMGEFMEKGGGVSESEGEEEDSKVTLLPLVCFYLYLRISQGDSSTRSGGQRCRWR